ncbi:MarR family transcriptional regulator [Quadrisphaera sp. INWT6]|nr:MarR family transcriptional regulator [Quadrisphaera sp. INWT6]
MGRMDEQLRAGLLHLSSLVVDGTEQASALVEPVVTASQLRVLDHLGERSVSTISAAAEALQVAVSTASRLADRLSAAGLLLRRDAADNRREVELVLTRQGREVLHRWLDARAAAMGDLLAAADGPDRDQLEDLVRRLGATSAPAAPAGAVVSRPRDAVVDLHRAMAAADPGQAPAVLVRTLAELTAAPRVRLHLLSQDCRVLVPLAQWPQPARGPAAAAPGQALSVDASAEGEALRTGRLVVRGHFAEVGHVWLHAPVLDGGRIGVLSAQPPPGAVQESWTDVFAALAEASGPVLVAACAGTRVLQLGTRTHPWTVSAEMQARQLGPRHVRTRGVEVATHLEPAWDAATDAHDTELVPATAGRGACLEVALLDCRTHRRRAPVVLALALGALRHARTLGLDLVDQVALVDQAVYGHHRGEATVDALVVRLQLEPDLEHEPDRVAVQAVATTGMRALLQRGGRMTALALAENDPVGATGDTRFVATEVPALGGDRLVLLGDGFGDPGESSVRAEGAAARAFDQDPQEVVRQVVANLLEAAGVDGPTQDATIACIDIAAPGR